MPPHIRSQATVDQGLFLSDLGILDREIADMCGVAVKTVRRWRRLYQRRGVVRTSNGSACPSCNGRTLDPASYALLLGAYLGDGHIVEMKRSVHRLTIYCSLIHINVAWWITGLRSPRSLKSPSSLRSADT